MSFSIDSWAFGNTPIEQALTRVSSARYTGIDPTAPAHLGRRAAPPAKEFKMMAGARGSKPWPWNLDVIAKCGGGPAFQLEHRMAENLGNILCLRKTKGR